MRRIVEVTHEHAEYPFKPLSFLGIYICAMSGMVEHWRALVPYCIAICVWTFACIAPLHQTQWLHGVPLALLMAIPALVFVIYASMITMRALACAYLKTTLDWPALAQQTLTEFSSKMIIMVEVGYKRLAQVLGLNFVILIGVAMAIGMILGFIFAALHGAFRQNLAMMSEVYAFAFIALLKIAAIPVFATLFALTSLLLPLVSLTQRTTAWIDPRFKAFLDGKESKQRLFYYGLMLSGYALVQWLIFFVIDHVINPNTGILFVLLWTLLTALFTIVLGALSISVNTLFFLDFHVRFAKLTSDQLDEEVARYSHLPVDPWAT